MRRPLKSKSDREFPAEGMQNIVLTVTISGGLGQFRQSSEIARHEEYVAGFLRNRNGFFLGDVWSGSGASPHVRKESL